MALFNQVQFSKPKTNMFNLSHDKKLTMQMGDLIPILCEEVLPGDEWKCNAEHFVRLAPTIAPIMHRVDVCKHYFFVPNRLIWDNWEDFITNENTDLIVPNITLGATVGAGSLADYLGVQSNNNPVQNINSLPFRAYNLIFNEYYRDQNLVDERDVPLGDEGSGPVTIARRAWQKDYFTSALPFTQKGDPVLLPLGQTAPVVSNYEDVEYVNQDESTAASGNIQIDNGGFLLDSAGFPINNFRERTGLEADLSEATASSVSDLRLAVRLQEWLERNARGGTRYIENILSHFGVYSKDARLQRPEYLGGGCKPLQISEVLQTSGTLDSDIGTSPQGNMSGHGISVGSDYSFKRRFTEHGYIFCIMSVMPKTAYMQGVRRHFMKQTPLDYFWPSFAHIGEQPIYVGELYNTGNPEENREVFGYQSRYCEYKYIPSSTHGDFKVAEEDGDNLSFYTMARYFENKPTLNSDFVSSNPTQRIYASLEEDVDKMWCQIYNKITVKRKIPKFSNPYL